MAAPRGPGPRPALVVCPGRPSLISAGRILARLEAWVRAGALAAPERLVVMGAKRWPRGVAGAAGRRLAGLVESAVFVPHDPGLAGAVSRLSSHHPPVRRPDHQTDQNGQYQKHDGALPVPPATGRRPPRMREQGVIGATTSTIAQPHTIL
ncbi:MAG TPA: hypothetical protein VFO16_06955 [Pseudonocardiaceae bacterium]|nr:hypothetical protein [Pseudonocardiaceae bacterium]